MTKEKYQKEIKLIQAQNNTEIELYPLATEIIQTATEGLSKRYVFGRKKSKKGNVYYGLSSFPDIAILDPELVKSAPPFITADTGLDVITHGLEAYVSETASDCSDCLAEKAAELAFEFLPRAYRNGYDIKARDKMHRASCLAGMAFNLVNLGVNHGIAHALGAIFHIPHGRANALVLPYVIEFNADMAREGAKHSNDAAKKYQKMARIVGLPAPTPKVGVANLIAEIQRLLKYMDRPQCMSECGVSVEEFNKHREEIVRRALADACTQANPRKVTAEDINKILDHIAK